MVCADMLKLGFGVFVVALELDKRSSFEVCVILIVTFLD